MTQWSHVRVIPVFPRAIPTALNHTRNLSSILLVVGYQSEPFRKAPMIRTPQLCLTIIGSSPNRSYVSTFQDNNAKSEAMTTHHDRYKEQASRP